LKVLDGFLRFLVVVGGLWRCVVDFKWNSAEFGGIFFSKLIWKKNFQINLQINLKIFCKFISKLIWKKNFQINLQINLKKNFQINLQINLKKN
jgi:hypothetical protein